MAQLSVFQGVNEFDDLWSFDLEGYATEALEEAGKVLEEQMKSNARAGLHHDGDSDMVNSIRAYKPKKTKTDAFIVNVGPRGYSKTKKYTAKDGKGKKTSRQYQVSNALKAIWKEYGIPGYRSAQPFISASVIKSERQVQDILQRKFEERMK